MANKYNEKLEKIWKKAEECNCGTNDCHLNSHRSCAICKEAMFYQAHESDANQSRCRGGWNTDHIVAKSRGGDNRIENLRAVHIQCNRNKSHN